MLELFKMKEAYETVRMVLENTSESLKPVKTKFLNNDNKTEDDLIEYCYNLVINSDLQERYRNFEKGNLILNEKEAKHYENSNYDIIDTQILDCISITFVSLRNLHGNFK